MVATKELKLAARDRRAQDEVWEKVERAQERLSRNLGQNVKAGQSASSLPLSYEHGMVRLSADRYVDRLLPVIRGKGDVIGYAFAVNGVVNSAEVYGSHALFEKLWPRLLKASAIEALTQLRPGRKVSRVTADEILACLREVEGKASTATRQAINGRVTLVTQKTDDNLLFETRDRKRDDVWVHRSYYTR
jgi:hypothetical protein